MQIVPTEPQFVELKVPLYSYGCEKKVKKALSNLRGIRSVHVDYHMQKVTVWGICNRDEVLATIRRKRREARFWDEIACSNNETIEYEELESLRNYKMRKSWKILFPLIM